MADHNSDGIAYLKALRQSIAATEPAEVPASAASEDGSGISLQGREKRRSPRYKCSGSGQIREEGSEIRTWVSFTDISLHGCYVEAQATFPVGTTLHMRLQANNIRIETTGTVRVSYPYLGMGIAFGEMSADNRAQLKELLGTLARPALIMGPGIVPSLSSTPLDAIPPVSDPAAAVRALVEFFQSRQILMREDFLKILNKSQSAKTKG